MNTERRRLRIAGWLILLVLVVLIVAAVSIWHTRDGRVTVRTVVSVTCDGADLAGTEVFLAGESLGTVPIEEFEFDRNDPRFLPLERGWTTQDLIALAMAELGDPDRLTVSQSMRRRPSDKGGWTDSTYVTIMRTRDDATIEPIVVAGWRVLDRNFATIVTFAGNWKTQEPVVFTSCTGRGEPLAWYDDRMNLIPELRIQLFHHP